MSNTHNLQRDQFHTDPDVSWQTVSPNYGPIANRTVRMANNQVVYQTEAFAHHSYTTSTGFGLSQWRAAGLYMTGPVGDATPYRIKGYANGFKSDLYVVIGYAPSTITGNDWLLQTIAFPIAPYDANGSSSGEFDEVIRLPGLADGDTYFGRALGIGIAQATSNGTVTQLAYALSVQNMSRTPPQYSTSAS